MYTDKQLALMYRRYKSGRTISGPPPKPIVKLEELLTSAQQEREEVRIIPACTGAPFPVIAATPLDLPAP